MDVLTDKVFKATEESIPIILQWIDDVANENLESGSAIKLQLVAEEAIVNVVKHAYADLEHKDDNNIPLEVILSKDEEYFTLTLKDNGRKFDPTQATKADPTLPFEERSIGGWGIAIMIQTTNFIKYNYENSQNVLTMGFCLGAEA